MDTTVVAWDRAFAALTATLALAVDKTNSVPQPIDLANAIIMPKLPYVAQHVWPSTQLAHEDEQRIQNVVWKSSFALSSTVIKGWAFLKRSKG
ncbi:Secreted peptide [Phytophthora megakarya]|uniref:Secreted peptide n=1 Tax=Phytophthora megakarya TaxID=4795 RepID=A0A225WS50_9STRA|nr:Secreted peptide [Phytophthora megakarya]